MTEIGNNKVLFLIQDDNNDFYYLTNTGSYKKYNSSDSLDEQAFTPTINISPNDTDTENTDTYSNISIADGNNKLVTGASNYKIVTTVTNDQQFPIQANFLSSTSIVKNLNYDVVYRLDQKDGITTYSALANINTNGNVKLVNPDNSNSSNNWRWIILVVVVLVIFIFIIAIIIFAVKKKKKKKKINEDNEEKSEDAEESV